MISLNSIFSISRAIDHLRCTEASIRFAHNFTVRALVLTSAGSGGGGTCKGWGGDRIGIFFLGDKYDNQSYHHCQENQHADDDGNNPFGSQIANRGSLNLPPTFFTF